MKTIRIFVVVFSLSLVLAAMPSPARAAQGESAPAAWQTGMGMVAFADVITETIVVKPLSFVVNTLATIAMAVDPQRSMAAAASANASVGLTQEQVSAVSDLLASFNTDTKVVAQIKLMLQGGRPAKPGSAGEGEHKMATSTKPGEGMRPPLARICPALANMLRRGNSGEEVKKLQEFLAGQGETSLEGSATGYFGLATEAALKSWQAKMGIVAAGDAETTGWGALGPKTRDLIKMKCGNMPEPKPGMGTTTRRGGEGKQPGGVMCTADAMQCPDGRYVGRSGPNCEFKCAPAPSTQ